MKKLLVILVLAISIVSVDQVLAARPGSALWFLLHHNRGTPRCGADEECVRRSYSAELKAIRSKQYKPGEYGKKEDERIAYLVRWLDEHPAKALTEQEQKR